MKSVIYGPWLLGRILARRDAEAGDVLIPHARPLGQSSRKAKLGGWCEFGLVAVGQVVPGRLSISRRYPVDSCGISDISMKSR